MENDLKTKIELFSALQILPLLFLPLLCELPYDSETANFHGSLIGEGTSCHKRASSSPPTIMLPP